MHPCPDVAVLICTRNRGALVCTAVASVLASAGVRPHVIVVDQSDDDSTQVAMVAMIADERVRYIRSNTIGLSRARNIGLRAAWHAVVLIVDDDVVVDSHWAARFSTALDSMPRAAVAFCRVDSAPHDHRLGFIPDHVIEQRTVVRSVFMKSTARGIGAGMAVRRTTVLALGGFDEMLGVGAVLRSAEDRDLATRALIAGWWVVQIPEAVVVHHGFRTWAEGAALTRRDWYGIGATYAKQMRIGDLRIVPVIIHEVLYFGLLIPVSRMLRGRRPRGIRKLGYFVQGFARGLRTPLDRSHLVYQSPATQPRTGI